MKAILGATMFRICFPSNYWAPGAPNVQTSNSHFLVLKNSIITTRNTHFYTNRKLFCLQRKLIRLSVCSVGSSITLSILSSSFSCRSLKSILLFVAVKIYFNARILFSCFAASHCRFLGLVFSEIGRDSP